MLIKEYFPDKEISCHCGCGLKSPREGVEVLYVIRLIMGIPIEVVSPIRCKQHNINEGGSLLSFHLPPDDADRDYNSWAFDLRAKNKREHCNYEYDLVYTIMKLGYYGIGIRDNSMVHFDNRIVKKIWGYK